jgi:orotate phosphoribosyltransferase
MKKKTCAKSVFIQIFVFDSPNFISTSGRKSECFVDVFKFNKPA